MKLFGRRGSEPAEKLTEQEIRLQQSIDSVLSSRNIGTISNEFEAEQVLNELLDAYGYSLNVQGWRDPGFSLEQNREQILRLLDEVHELLESPLANTPIKAALSSFVFNAGVAFGANVELVESAFGIMMTSGTSNTFSYLTDEDLFFADQLKNYLLSLNSSEAKAILSSFKEASEGISPQLLSLIEKLQLASSAQQEKQAKSAGKGILSKEGNSSVVPPKFCGNCGTSLKPGAKFCGSCGKPVAIS